MVASFSVEVVTPTRLVLRTDATSLVAPGIDGYLGVMANHAPLITELTIGHVAITEVNDAVKVIAISGGFMEVQHNKVTVLADTAELAEEIDIARAEEAKRRAEELLAKGGRDVDMNRAQTSLMRSINRLHAAGELRRD